MAEQKTTGGSMPPFRGRARATARRRTPRRVPEAQGHRKTALRLLGYLTHSKSCLSRWGFAWQFPPSATGGLLPLQPDHYQ
jgi:hypothetical protein